LRTDHPDYTPNHKAPYTYNASKGNQHRPPSPAQSVEMESSNYSQSGSTSSSPTPPPAYGQHREYLRVDETDRERQIGSRSQFYITPSPDLSHRQMSVTPVALAAGEGDIYSQIVSYTRKLQEEEEFKGNALNLLANISCHTDKLLSNHTTLPDPSQASTAPFSSVMSFSEPLSAYFASNSPGSISPSSLLPPFEYQQNQPPIFSRFPLPPLRSTGDTDSMFGLKLLNIDTAGALAGRFDRRVEHSRSPLSPNLHSLMNHQVDQYTPSVSVHPLFKL
jgi:hypothetical protein